MNIGIYIININILTIHAVRLRCRSGQSLRQGSLYASPYPAKDSVVAILKATGKPVDEAQVDAVLKALNGRKVEDVHLRSLRSLAKDSPK